MARPRAARYEEARQEILHAAARLFAQRGYTAATMSEVARASGLSKATLYHYFGDKQAILEEIALTHVRRLQAVIQEQMPAHAASATSAGTKSVPAALSRELAHAQLHRLLAGFMHAYTGAQHAHRVLAEDVKFLDPPARRRVVAAQRQVVSAFAQALADLRPDLPSPLHTPLAMLLLGMINWTYLWLKPGKGLSHPDLAPIVADLFWGGLPAVRAAQA